MTHSTASPAPLTNVEQLSNDLQALNISSKIIKPGWLTKAYLGGNCDNFDSPAELSKFLSEKYAGVSLQKLSVGEFLELLEEVEANYPKFRA